MTGSLHRRCGLFTLMVSTALAGCSTSTPQADEAPATSARPATPVTSADAPTEEPAPVTTADPEEAVTSWGPTRAQLRVARHAVRQMTVHERAGQVLVARYAGTAAPTALVDAYHLGGVIVMADNVASVAAVRRSNRRLQRTHEQPWPLLIGVDQEGGIVNRLGAPLTRFPTFMTYGAARRPDLTTAAAEANGTELRATGFTAVFAPVTDVTIGPADPTIGSRSAGSRPSLVADTVTSAIAGYRTAGIVPVVKHFPGHGALTTDSHVDLPVQAASLRELHRRDLRPFAAAVDAGAPAVMTGHIDVRAVDPGVPATLSRPVISGLLRERLGFEGLVVTDAMEMAAIGQRFGTGDAVVRALRAGVDMVLMPPDLDAAHTAIVRAVRTGRLPARRLRSAATKVVAVMLHTRARPRPPASVIGAYRGVSRRASRAAMTVVAGPCRGRLVGPSVVATGDAAAVRRFTAAARAAGLQTGTGDTVALLGYGAGPAVADVVVALDTPYVLGDSTAAVAKVAAYGQTPGVMRALVDVLLGKASARGRLPVRMPGVVRRGC